MNKRYLGAVFLAPLIIFLFLGGIYLKILILLLSLIGMHEFYTAVRNKQIYPMQFAGYLLCLVYYIVLANNLDFKYIMLILSLGVIIMLCIPVFKISYNFNDISATILGFIYVAVFFSFVVLVDTKVVTHNSINVYVGKYLVWLIFAASWCCDTLAYYSGKYLGKGGKHKLCPKVSPNKTVEGAIGGLLGSIIGCIIFGYVANKYGTNMMLINIQLYHYVMIGLFCGIFSQFGDLAASSIKRYAGIKDYGKIIPGHGGILDRFDSILFSAAVVYYYLSFILNI